MTSPFYESPLFTSIVTSIFTLLVGIVAFVVYQKQQNDKKKDAATIILLEVQYAEDHLAIAKESIIRDGLIKEDVFLMPTSSWQNYKYLFVRDFSSKGIADISSFYEKCSAYDHTVRYNNSFFVKNEEEIRRSLQGGLSDYTKSYISEIANASDEEKKTALEAYHLLINEYARVFMDEVTSSQSQYFYKPLKPLNDAKTIIETVRSDLSSSTIGATFNKIVERNLRQAIHDYLLGVKKSQII